MTKRCWRAGRVSTGRDIFLMKTAGENWWLRGKLPVRKENGDIVGLVGIGRNITASKEADQKLEEVHRELLEVSRQAGMAEVATGGLHNVGNVLNSVNVAAEMIGEQIRTSKGGGVARVAKLLQEHSGDLGKFLSDDERGRQVPVYLKQLGDHLEQERFEMVNELEGLKRNIEHIKEIVATQLNYAKVFGVVETVELPAL